MQFSVKCIPRIFALVLLTVFPSLSTVLLSQSCLDGVVKFTNQQQIDSFPLLYPGCIEINADVIISSETGIITNLHGLSAVTLIKEDLVITKNPQLENLAGLHNLTAVGTRLRITDNDQLSSIADLAALQTVDYFISVSNNPSLMSLAGLDNVELDYLDAIHIVDNPQLEHCDILSVCEHLFRHSKYWIYNNGPGCNFMEEVYAACQFGPDSLSPFEQLCLEEGFEEWETSGDTIRPGEWKIDYPGFWITNDTPNVERVHRLNEGNSAILIRSNGPGLEGPERTLIEHPLCSFPSSVDIAFTYTCRGVGNCELILGQSSSPTGGVNHRSIWNGQTADTIKRTVVLNNIPVNSPFSGFQKIQFRANPVYWSNGSYGVSEFTIDSVVVREYSIPSAFETGEVKPSILVYPNPVKDIVYWRSDQFPFPDQLTVYSSEGVLLFQQKHNSEIDLSSFPAGMYLIDVQSNHQRSLHRVIKI